MNKRRVHHYLSLLRRIKTWQLVMFALLLSVAAVILLRHNSLEAVRLFEAVKRADRAGQPTGAPLSALQRYTAGHMNTQLERVTLEETYARDYRAALRRLAESGTVNAVDYQAAEAACRSELAQTGSFPAYAQCVSSRAAQTAPGENPQLRAALPEPARYHYSFLSPAFSPDAAGLTLLAAGVMWLTIIAKVVLQQALRLLVRQRSLL